MKKQKCLWGVALSAGQSEGAYLEEGKGLSIIDTVDCSKQRCFARFGMPEEGRYYSSHVASDLYHHLDEDMELLKELGAQCFRTSFAWSRLFPTGEEKKPNPQGLAFYERMIDKCLAANCEPIITLSHLEIPYALYDKYGGWEDPHFIDCFYHYAKTIISHFKDKVKYWITFNEINCALHFPSFVGVGADRSQDPLSTCYQAMHNMFVANAKVVEFAHGLDDELKIGCMIAYSPIYPLTSKPEDVYKAMMCERENLLAADVLVHGHYPAYAKQMFAAKKIHIAIQENDLALIEQNRSDFLAVSYYNTQAQSADECQEHSRGNLFGGIKNPYLDVTQWGWPIDPLGIKIMLQRLDERYDGFPLMIVENGIGAQDVLINGKIHDDYRIAYLQQHITNVQEAIDQGVNLWAYTMWSFIDIISASGGKMSKRYGLVYVDRDDEGHGTNARYRKDSYYWYQQLLKKQLR